MTDQGRDSAVFSFFWASVICGLSTGCGGLHFSTPDQQRGPDRSQPPAAVEPASEGGERATLAAVEEFLVRTRDYRMPSTISSDPPTTPLPVTIAMDSAPPAISSRSMEQPGKVGGTASRPEKASANMQMTLAENASGQRTLALPVIESLAIQVPTPVETPGQEPPLTNTTNHPLKLHADQTVLPAERFLTHLESLAEEAADFATEWQLRLTQTALNRDTEAAEVSANLPRDARRILLGLIRLAVAARHVAADPLLPGDEALERIEELRRVLADRADPTISTVALCSKVVTFGVYDELSSGDFIAGRSTPAIVYSEIRNLRSEQTADGQYQSVLATRLEVLTATGESVWEHEEPEIVDQCRRPRTDFFLAHRIALPPTLAAGDYVLKVLVEDKLSGKANEYARRFAISARTSVATNR